MENNQEVNSQILKPSVLPAPTPHKKSFFKNPFFWAVIAVLFVVAGEFYFVYTRIDTTQVLKVKEAVKNPINLPSPTLSLNQVVSTESAKILNKITDYYPQSTSWKEKIAAINIIKNGKKIIGLEKSGTYISDGNPEWCEIFCEDSELLQKDGWIEDSDQAADGLLGSVRGYKKVSGGQEQILHVEWSRDKRGPYPITYTYKFFLSERY